MSSSTKLSLAAAILISVNIMLGTGVFINTVILAQKTGALGFLLYLISGTLMLPLILCVAQLSALQAQGNFFTFGALISPFFGFISTWSYFFAKLASASLSIHVFNTFLKATCPFLSCVPTLFLDLCLLSLFVLLNTLKVHIGKRIQAGFLSMKIILFCFALFVGLYCAKLINIGAPHHIWSGIPIGLPLVFFCLLGFEASCSLSHLIENSQKNAPLAIITAFSIVVGIITIYQFLFYASVGPSALSQQSNYTNAFPLLVAAISPTLVPYLAPFFSIAIATSALGGAYGILYINGWNLYNLAQRTMVIGSSRLSALNAHGIPTLCIVAQGLTCALFILLTGGSQIPLQYTAVLGSIATYAICVCALFKHSRSYLSIAGILTCIVLLAISLYAFIKTSIIPLCFFIAILASGVIMFFNNTTAKER